MWDILYVTIIGRSSTFSEKPTFNIVEWCFTRMIDGRPGEQFYLN
jgi:hypothetical protein